MIGGIPLQQSPFQSLDVFVWKETPPFNPLYLLEPYIQKGPTSHTTYLGVTG